MKSSTQTIEGVRVKIQTVDEVYSDVCALGSWCPPLLTVNNSLDATARKMLAMYLVRAKRPFFAKADGGVITVSYTSEGGDPQSEVLMTSKSVGTGTRPSTSHARTRERMNWHRLNEKIEALAGAQDLPALPGRVEINSTEIAIKEWQGERVVTFKDIDEVHQRPAGTARNRFSANRNRFILGTDCFVCQTYEARKAFGITAPNGLVILTESGYLMLVKTLTDDLSWQVQRELVNTYFKARSPEPPTAPIGGAALPFALLRTIMTTLETHRELITQIDSKATRALAKADRLR